MKYVTRIAKQEEERKNPSALSFESGKASSDQVIKTLDKGKNEKAPESEEDYSDDYDMDPDQEESINDEGGLKPDIKVDLKT